MELGKNATDDLCNSSKWPFWQASMKIHLILVYWDAFYDCFFKINNINVTYIGAGIRMPTNM